jgi:hypothetical protein
LVLLSANVMLPLPDCTVISDVPLPTTTFLAFVASEISPLNVVILPTVRVLLLAARGSVFVNVRLLVMIPALPVLPPMVTLPEADVIVSAPITVALVKSELPVIVEFTSTSPPAFRVIVANLVGSAAPLSKIGAVGLISVLAFKVVATEPFRLINEPFVIDPPAFVILIVSAAIVGAISLIPLAPGPTLPSANVSALSPAKVRTFIPAGSKCATLDTLRIPLAFRMTLAPLPAVKVPPTVMALPLAVIAPPFVTLTVPPA